MTCTERRDSILLHALNANDNDALAPPERESIRSHLATGCPTCSAALAEAEATLAQIPFSLPLQTPSPSVRDRLMQRVLATPIPASARASQASVVWRSLAACLVIGLSLFYLYFIKPGHVAQLASRDAQIATRNTQLSERDAKIAQLMSQVSVAQDQMKMLDAENLQMVSLNKAEPQPNAKGRLIWDRDRDMWHVSVFDMKPPEPGQTFELWYITPDQRKIAAGTFDVDAKGNGSIIVKLPKDIGPVAVAAITNEPIGGVEQPTGKVHILAELNKPLD